MGELPQPCFAFLDVLAIEGDDLRTAEGELAGLWVDRAENINGNYAISDKPLSEQEWEDQYARKH
jgi:hypothetical protein